MIGVYSLNSSMFDIWMMWVFGIIGYFMKKYDISGAPMIIGLVLGPILEQSLYRALSLAHGSMLVFVTRPISATLLGIAVVMSIFVSFKTVKTVRKQLSDERADGGCPFRSPGRPRFRRCGSKIKQETLRKTRELADIVHKHGPANIGRSGVGSTAQGDEYGNIMERVTFNGFMSVVTDNRKRRKS